MDRRHPDGKASKMLVFLLLLSDGVEGIEQHNNPIEQLALQRESFPAAGSGQSGRAVAHVAQELDPVGGMPGGDPFEQLQVGKELV